MSSIGIRRRTGLLMLIEKALHNLRSALGQLAWSLAGTSADQRTEFPIFIDRAKFGAGVSRLLPSLLKTWLPDGVRRGSEWVARNPRRSDRHPGSFSINLPTGRWADFATGDVGGDPISLAAGIQLCA
jgi:hypothetical protein